jgi:hypothetical protein
LTNSEIRFLNDSVSPRNLVSRFEICKGPFTGQNLAQLYLKDKLLAGESKISVLLAIGANWRRDQQDDYDDSLLDK